jgi:hypothetical protein
MTTPSVGVERRIGQRFALNVPVSLCELDKGTEGLGFTQDLSSRGAFLFTDMALAEGAEVQLTLIMPSEITLGENMRVRCRGRVLRIEKPLEKNRESTECTGKAPETKIGVAVCLKGYEYLPENENTSADFRRISALHNSGQAERTPATIPAISPTAVP